MKGNVIDLNFDLYDVKDKKVASTRKKFFSLAERYEIEVENEKDALLALAIVVAISNDCFDETSILSSSV